MNKLKIALSSLFILALISGCYYDKEDKLYPNASYCDTTNVTFAGTIKPIITSRCATPGCHITGGQPPELTTYSLIVTSLTRVKVRAIDLKTMPSAGPLSDCEIAKLQIWINAGNPNN